jgi:hypothetical protein
MTTIEKEKALIKINIRQSVKAQYVCEIYQKLYRFDQNDSIRLMISIKIKQINPFQSNKKIKHTNALV